MNITSDCGLAAAVVANMFLLDRVPSRLRREDAGSGWNEEHFIERSHVYLGSAAIGALIILWGLIVINRSDLAPLLALPLGFIAALAWMTGQDQAFTPKRLSIGGGDSVVTRRSKELGFVRTMLAFIEVPLWVFVWVSVYISGLQFASHHSVLNSFFNGNMAYPFIGFAFLAYVFGTVRWSLWKVSQTDEAPQAVLASTSWWYGFSGIFALASIAIEEWGRTLWPLSLAPMLAAALCESAAIGIFCAWFLRRTGHRTIAKVTFGKAAWLCLDGNKKLVSLRLDYLNGGDIGIRAARSGTELLWGALQLSALLLAAIFLLKAVSGS